MGTYKMNFSRDDAVKAAQNVAADLKNNNYDLVELPCRFSCKCERSFELKQAEDGADFASASSVVALTEVMGLSAFPDAQACRIRNWQRRTQNRRARWCRNAKE